MSRFRQRKERELGVDISPLIDMVFILLIFFMVTTTFVKDMKLELERPNAASASRASTKAVRVYLDRTGDIHVEGAPVKAWMLQSRITDLMKSLGQSPVLVITDRLVPAERLIEVIDQCRLAGAEDVGVATEQESG
jgi:biopolymer transport protein ExbD